jgi:hypothetical protein
LGHIHTAYWLYGLGGGGMITAAGNLSARYFGLHPSWLADVAIFLVSAFLIVLALMISKGSALKTSLESAPQVLIEYAFSIKAWSSQDELAQHMSVPFVLTNVRDSVAFRVRVHDIVVGKATAKFSPIDKITKTLPVSVQPRIERGGQLVTGIWRNAFAITFKDAEIREVPVRVSYQDIQGKKFLSSSILICDFSDGWT